MPALVESIKELGLVLVADTSDDVGEASRVSNFATPEVGIGSEWTYRMPEGVNGVMRGSGVLRFNDTIDM
jgi:CDK inhibitor PHO81